MSWGWVMAIIAVVMVAMLVGFAIWLWRLLTDIWAEVVVLGRRGAQIVELLETLDLTPLDREAGPRPAPRDVGFGADLDDDEDWDDTDDEDDEDDELEGIGSGAPARTHPRPSAAAPGTNHQRRTVDSPDRGI